MALFLAAVAAVAGAAEPARERVLSYETLTDALTIAAPLDLAEFGPPAGALPPAHTFSGRLMIRARPGRSHSDAAARPRRRRAR